MIWACSACQRQFENIENVRCHVLRNSKFSARKATHIKLEIAVPQMPILEEPLNIENYQLNIEEKKENVFGQRPASAVKNRTGVRHFPAALTCKIAKEGKEIA